MARSGDDLRRIRHHADARDQATLVVPRAAARAIAPNTLQHLLDGGVVDSGSEIARREGLHHSTVNELLRLTLLEPAITQAILAGKQPRCMSLLWFQRNPLPTDRAAQREVLARFDA